MRFSAADFEEIRPYNDNEVPEAISRTIASPYFDTIVDFLFPGHDKEQMRAKLAKVSSVKEFQDLFMYPLISNIIRRTSEALSCEGLENMTPGNAYLLIANHRDIAFDLIILEKVMYDNGFGTTEITFGSNLMTSQFIIDLGKMNRMFVVNRTGNTRELFRNSQLLSSYIRHTITDKKVPLWIAQRNGRTKDGNDRTEPGLIKMFSYSGNGDFNSSMRELNMIPLSISYEYEPCCDLKIREVSTRMKQGFYRKAPDEDLKSIIAGITRPKGRIHLSFGKNVGTMLEGLEDLRSSNDRINLLAGRIDEEIYRNYKLWPNNYIAFDMLQGSHEYAGHYSEADRHRFLRYMEEELGGLEVEEPLKRELFLKIYANPVINARSVKGC